MKLINNAKSILKTDIISDSSSFLVQDGEGDLFKYEIDGATTNEFTIFAEEVENDIIIKREPIKVKRDGDVFTILERKSQFCVGNDSATPKLREQKKYNFTAGVTQISMYMSEDDIDEIENNIIAVENIKAGEIKMNVGVDVLEIVKDDDSLGDLNISMIDVEEIVLNGNNKNEAGGIIELDLNGLVPVANLPETSVEVENLLIKALTPAETNGLINGKNPIFLYRKGTGNEESNKIYKDTTGEILGLLSGITDGYENPLQTYSGELLSIYGLNIFGGVIQHNQTSVSGIKLNGYKIGTGTFDFGLYPFSGGNLDTNNPIVEKTGINFTEVSTRAIWNIADYYSNVHQSPSTYRTVTGSEQTMTFSGTLNITYQFKSASGTVRIVKNGIIVYTQSTTSNTFIPVDQDIEVVIGDVIKMEEAHNYSSNPMDIDDIVYQGGIPFFTINFTESTILANTDYGFLLNNSGGDVNNAIILSGDQVTDTKLLKSTAGIGATMSPIAGGIYNRIISQNPITAINLINTGIYEHFEDIQDNTDYYITSLGELITSPTGNTLIGKSISIRKILLSI